MGGVRGERVDFNLQKISTIFVDNLPLRTRKIWVHNLFSRFGKIKDVYIPNKKSKVTGQNFGFIRFFSNVSASLALAEMNGYWCWGHKLRVNFARFLRKEDYHENQRMTFRAHTSNSHFNQENKVVHKGKRGNEVWRKKGITESSKQGEERNAKIVYEATKENLKIKTSIQIHPIGNGWLARSAIAKINRLVSPKDLVYIFSREEVHNVQVKAMGGRFVIITFPDALTRDSIICKKWMSNWFEVIKPWNGEQAKDERFVWLSCYGMPLNGWSSSTFKAIGNHWGHFIQVDENTLEARSFDKGSILIATEQIQKIEGNIELIIEGVSYIIRVVEENSFRTYEHNSVLSATDVTMDEEAGRENNYDDLENCRDDVAKNAVMEANKDDRETDKEVGASNYQLKMAAETQLMNEAAINFISSPVETKSSAEGDELVMDSVEGLLSSSSPIKGSDNYNQEFGYINDEGINTAAVDDEFNEEIHIKDGPTFNPNDPYVEGQQLDLVEDNHVPIQAAIKGIKGKKKRKSIDEIMGLTKINMGNKNGGRNKNKCTIYRSASAAVALSVSTEGIVNRNRILLNEVQAVWALDKLLGNDYTGSEDEVISKIIQMEVQDEERAAMQANLLANAS